MAEMPEDDLEPLITECPSCHTRFRVAETQLQRAGGRVRCGACLAVFHGIDHLVLASMPGAEETPPAQQALDDLLDELAGGPQSDPGASPSSSETVPPMPSPGRPERGRDRAPLYAGFEEPAEHPQEVRGPALSFRVLEDADIVEPQREAVQQQDSASEPEPPLDERPPDGGTDVAAVWQADEHPTQPSTPVVFGELRPRRPLVWLAIVAGILLLVAQVLVYQFDDWAKRGPWRAVYGPICRVVGCELPVQSDAALLATRNLVVRTHPRETGVLLVNAVIVNRASFAQPFPVLELQFTTVAGDLVASRRFEPDEYLAGDARGMTLMPPRTPVQIELTMDDPGPHAVNYRLYFR